MGRLPVLCAHFLFGHEQCIMMHQALESLYMSLCLRKQTICISDQVSTNRPVQSQKIARSLKFGMKEGEGLYYPSSENKGADHGNREADLHLCFLPSISLVFLCSGSYVSRDPGMTLTYFTHGSTVHMSGEHFRTHAMMTLWFEFNDKCQRRHFCSTEGVNYVIVYKSCFLTPGSLLGMTCDSLGKDC